MERIKAALPQLEASIPPSIHVSTIIDRTQTIRASVTDVQFTLMLSICLVVMVIFLFLRNVWATIIPSVTVPVALICTFGVMYLLGYSLDNLSLMALTIAVGFVVDDAIVMLENIYRHMEEGMKPMEAAHQGRRRDRLHHRLDQLLAGRRVHSAAADGRHRRAAVPRIRHDRVDRRAGLGVRLADADADDVLALPASHHTASTAGSTASSRRMFDGMMAFYRRTLDIALRFRFITLLVFLAHGHVSPLCCTSSSPRASFPPQDTGIDHRHHRRRAGHLVRADGPSCSSS